MLRIFILVLSLFSITNETQSMNHPANYPTNSEYKIGSINIKQIHFNEVDSTQTWLYQNVNLDKKQKYNWVLVTADKQTAGIGTHNRKWVSHIPGNVYASLSFPVEITYDSIPPVPQLSALAVYDAVEQLSAIAVRKTVKQVIETKDCLKIQIKWPNDVIVDGKKISGSLAVVRDFSDGLGICVLGVGINVNLSQDVLDTITEQKATSMLVVTGKSYNEKDVLRVYLENFINIFDSYQKTKMAFFDKFYKNMAFIGERIKVHDDSRHKDKDAKCSEDCYIEGVMLGVADNGFLKLKMDNEQVEYVYSGTVVKK